MSDPGSSSIVWLVFGIIAAFLIIFPLFWIAVVWLISLFAGWRKLVARYLATLPRDGKFLGGQTVLVNHSRYRNTMDVVTNPVGLWMQPMWLFRAGHAPLFIPWSELSNPRPTAHRGQQLVRLDVGMPPVATMALPSAVLQDNASAVRLLKTTPPM